MASPWNGGSSNLRWRRCRGPLDVSTEFGPSTGRSGGSAARVGTRSGGALNSDRTWSGWEVMVAPPRTYPLACHSPPNLRWWWNTKFHCLWPNHSTCTARGQPMRGGRGSALASAASIGPASGGGASPTSSGGRLGSWGLATRVATFLEAVRANPRTGRVVLMPSRGSSEELQRRIRRSRRMLADRIEPLLGWGIKQRGGPSGFDLELGARLIVAAGEDAARLTLAHPRRFAPERFAIFAAEGTALLPTRVRPRDPPPPPPIEPS